jgi:glycosyltransferase involved in cell wall biosynthesis
MKILYFSPHPNLYLQIPSGPGVHMREMMLAFETLGHEVKPLIMGGTDAQLTTSGSSPNQTSLKERIKWFIPKVLWASAKDINLNKFDLHAKSELLKAIKEFEPDVIYERANYAMVSGVEAAKEMNIPHILEMNAPYPEEKAGMEGKGLFHHKSIQKEMDQLTKTNLVVVVSSALENYVKKRVPNQQVVITPNAIRSNLTPPDQNVKLRQKFGISTQALVFGFVGSIFPYHGVDRLIEAFAKLKIEQAHLVIVGDGYVLDELKSLSTQLNITDKVTFTGSVPHSEIYSHIGAMDITIMAKSNWYGSPVKIFEYGAMNKAIIAPNVIPVQDVMIHEQDGLLVEPTVTSISDAMNTLANDPELRLRLAASFHAKVKSQHTWTHMAELILQRLTSN